MNNRQQYILEQRKRELLKKKKAKMIRNRLIILQIIVFALLLSLICMIVFLPGNSKLADMEIEAPQKLSEEKALPASAKADNSQFIIEIKDEISSTNAILIHLDSGEVIAQKDPDEVIYPASMTKIMTVLVAIEHYENYEDYVEIPSDIFGYLTEQNASVAGFKAGEKVKIEDLFYGAMLPSGADACLALAKNISGSEQAFAKKMTEKAHEIGASEATNFTNCTGLHSNAHTSTVRDMAKILTYALNNKTFEKVFTTETHTTDSTTQHPYGIKLSSTTFKAFNRIGKDPHKLVGVNQITGELLGGKTGFTGEARLCLASLASMNNREYILVTAGAGTPTSYSGTKHASDAHYIYTHYIEN